MRMERDFTIVQLLDLVTRELCHLLEIELKEIGGKEWWEQRVLSVLSRHQREQVTVKGFTTLEDFDLATLLHIFDNNWRDIQERRTLDKSFRTYLKEMREIRNRCIGHASVRGLPTDDVIRYLDTIGRFAEGLRLDSGLVVEIRQAHERALVEKAKSLIGNDVPRDEAAAVIPIVEPTPESMEEPEATETGQTVVYEIPGRVTQMKDGFQSSLHANVLWCTHDDLLIPTIGVIVEVDGIGRELRARLPYAFAQTADAISRILDAEEGRRLSMRFLNVEVKGSEIIIPEPGSVPLDRIPLIVLEPHWLINVTALTHFDYCPRNYFINRYQLQPRNEAMLRGSFVHEVFDHILEHPADRTTLLASTASALGAHALDMQMIGSDPTGLYSEARNHLNGLLLGVKAQQTGALAGITAIYPERFIINPNLGLKGKIDVIAEKSNGHKQAIELKTGKPWGGSARAGDAFQVQAYHLMMLFKGETNLDAPMVVYSGEAAKKLKDGQAIDDGWTQFMFLAVDFNVDTAMAIMDLRNQLVAADYMHSMSFESNERKCFGCAKTGKDRNCSRLHDLGISGGRVKSPALQGLDANAGISAFPVDGQLVKWFKTYNDAIAAEHAAVKKELGTFIALSQEERAETGRSLIVTAAANVDTGGLLRLTCPEVNRSEFREGDPCLLSDVSGPVHGECLEVYIAEVGHADLVVRVPAGVRRLWFAPKHLDNNASETHFENNFGALYDFLDDQSPHTEVLAPLRRILLDGQTSIPSNDMKARVPVITQMHPSLLPAQGKAVQAACGLNQILLVQGPPGSGKTYTVARMIQALHGQGKRILVATYTHRASDELMKKLRDHAPEVPFVKLGRSEATAYDLVEFSLDTLLAPDASNSAAPADLTIALDQARQRYEDAGEVLRQRTVFIGTTHAWTSSNYDGLAAAVGDDDHFDVAIIDETSQVILPQMLGTLRHARKWILVGDHRQLPPVLLSDGAAPLARTLFEMLHEDVENKESTHIMLGVQHRMPHVLAGFISDTFYNGALQTVKEDQLLNVNATGKFASVLNDNHKIVLIHTPADKNTPARISKREAVVVKELVTALRDANYPLVREDGAARIGIIAPYRAQVAHIRRMLERELQDSDLARQMVDTVDRFQGDEREIILLTTCLRAEDKSVPVLYRDARRINVALSRARAKLIVIGDLRLARAIPDFERLIAYVHQQHEHCTSVNVTF